MTLIESHSKESEGWDSYIDITIKQEAFILEYFKKYYLMKHMYV